MSLSAEFRRNHRVASESLIRAVESDSLPDICRALDEAATFERQAMDDVATSRQRALGMGLLHAVDLIRAVAHAEFRREP